MPELVRDLRSLPALVPTLPAPDLSVVIPLFNEAENVRPLLQELFEVLDGMAGKKSEVICVDDGSRDRTFAELTAFANNEPRLRVIRFRRNFGQTAAMSAGIEASRGAVIVPMDGDLQNDPADIPRLLATLEGNGDEAPSSTSSPAGVRTARTRSSAASCPRSIANKLISRISGVRLHDYGCSLKAYRRDVLADVKLYGEMHRFIPIYASWQGARVTEQVVNHRARRAGVSKYGLGRTGKVVLDLLVVKFLASFTTKPIYVFGGFGLASLLLSFLAFFGALGLKLTGLRDFVSTPLPLLGVMFMLAGMTQRAHGPARRVDGSHVLRVAGQASVPGGGAGEPARACCARRS